MGQIYRQTGQKSTKEVLTKNYRKLKKKLGFSSKLYKIILGQKLLKKKNVTQKLSKNERNQKLSKNQSETIKFVQKQILVENCKEIHFDKKLSIN